jgi:hypothetical protein
VGEIEPYGPSPPEAVQDLGSNAARGALAGDGAWSWSEPVLVGVECDEPDAGVVEVVVAEPDGDVVVVVVEDAGVEGGTTAKSDPVMTATWAPAGTGP